MDQERIVALLKSDNEADNLLGLHILRAKSADWHDFKCTLRELTICETYTYKWINGYCTETCLRDKYFDKSAIFELKPKYIDEIP